MTLDLTDEQKQLKDQVQRLLTEHVKPDLLRKVITEDTGFDPELWRMAGELGLLGAAIPEEFGGVGLGEKDLCVIAEEMGRAVAPIPFFSSICLAAEAIKLAGTDAQKASPRATPSGPSPGRKASAGRKRRSRPGFRAAGSAARSRRFPTRRSPMSPWWSVRGPGSPWSISPRPGSASRR
jgi:acyl-CoA dehydrogenase